MKTLHLSAIILSALLTSASAQGQASSGGAGSAKSTRLGEDQQRYSTSSAGNANNRYVKGQPEQQPNQTLWGAVNGGSRYQKGDGVFVLRFSAETKDQSNLESDLGVMSHLLHKTLSEKFGNVHAGRNVLGINVAFAPGAQPLRTAYLEGYGALFLLNISFPLYPPPTQETDAKEKTDTDSAWEEAKREYYGESSERYAKVVNEYDEQKVSELKSALLEALKSGSNIRGLRPDEHIIICVSGAPTAVASASTGMAGGGYSAYGLGGRYGSGGGVLLAEVPTRGSVLTLRVKKSDVDSFAAGKLSLEEFSRTVTSATYQTRAGAWPGEGAFYPSGGGVEYLLTDPTRRP
jgi:hypothetical protein